MLVHWLVVLFVHVVTIVLEADYLPIAGTAIYISTLAGPGSGIFTATIDDNSVDVNASALLVNSNSDSEDCAVTWSQWGLQNKLHNVSVVFKGQGTETAPTPGLKTSFGISGFM